MIERSQTKFYVCKYFQPKNQKPKKKIKIISINFDEMLHYASFSVNGLV